MYCYGKLCLQTSMLTLPRMQDYGSNVLKMSPQEIAPTSTAQVSKVLQYLLYPYLLNLKHNSNISSLGFILYVMYLILVNYIDFQIPVTGLLIFAMAFGSLALILSLCGVCTVTLPKKVYYYHSAGEIYLMCCKLSGY